MNWLKHTGSAGSCANLTSQWMLADFILKSHCSIGIPLPETCFKAHLSMQCFLWLWEGFLFSPSERSAGVCTARLSALAAGRITNPVP